MNMKKREEDALLAASRISRLGLSEILVALEQTMNDLWLTQDEWAAELFEKLYQIDHFLAYVRVLAERNGYYDI